MIQSIEIQNFQSHENTRVELHPGLNIVLGAGDSGKSAILRGIRWNQSNRIRHDDRPMGDSYVSDWAKSTGAKGATTLLADCKVTITKPEGTCSRFREAPRGKGDKERNGYELNGQRFEAIGVTVPDPVSQFFNWSEVNVQRQADKAFLISQNAGEVASFLNRTVRLDAIDTHIQAASQLVRQEKDTLKLLQSKQADDQKALEALAWVPEVELRLEALEALVKTRDTLRIVAQGVRGIGDQIEVQEQRIRASERIVSMEPKVQELRRLNDWRRGLMDQRRKLMETADQWERWISVSKASEGVVELGSRVQGLRDLVEQQEAVESGRRALMALRTRWTASESVLRDQGRIVSMESRVQALRTLMDQRKTLGLLLTECRDLVERWTAIKVVPCDWESLGRSLKILRARVSRVQAIREQIRGLQSFRLTFADLETIIQGAGERVAELVAMRPATCPLCGGPMHKGEHS